MKQLRLDLGSVKESAAPVKLTQESLKKAVPLMAEALLAVGMEQHPDTSPDRQRNQDETTNRES